MVERTAFNRMVVGSSPTVGTSAEVPERSKGVDLRSTATASWVRIPPLALNTKKLTAIPFSHFKRVVVGSSPTRGKCYVSSVGRAPLPKCFLKFTSSYSSAVERCAYDAVALGSIPSRSITQ